MTPDVASLQSGGGGGGYLGNKGYMFVSNRMRSPGGVGQATAGRENSVHKSLFYSPPYLSNNFRMAFSAHYTKVDGSVPSEIALTSTFTIKCALHAFIGGSWVAVAATFGGNPSITVDPAVNSVGVLADDVVFTQDVPANTPMRACVYVVLPTSGGIGVVLKNRSGTEEGALGHASTDLTSYLTNTGSWSTPSGGGDGRLGGSIFAPTFIVAKAVNGLDRPAFLVSGDSIAFGKNQLENLGLSTYGDFGFIGYALGDDSRSRRMCYYNSAVPGTGMGELQDRTKWSRRLDLIRLVPNRPYTHVINEHYNNGPAGDYTTVFKPAAIAFLAQLKTESQAWGDAAAPIHQTRPIPRPSVWPYSLAAQASPGEPLPSANRWLFDADLVAGNVYADLADAINVNRDYAYDQGVNRDKIKVTSFATTLAADTTASSTISLTHAPPLFAQILIGPGAGNVARHVTAVSGSGPYAVTVDTAVSAGIVSGTAVQEVLAADSQGLHPALLGHRDYMAPPIIDWKIAKFG